MLERFLDTPEERFYNGRIAIQNEHCYAEVFKVLFYHNFCERK